MTPVNRTAAILLGIVTTILLGWVLRVGAHIIQPIVIALLMASMLSPVVRGLARLRIPPLVSVLGMVTLLGFGIFQAVTIAQKNIEAFLRDTPAALDSSDERGSAARTEGRELVAGLEGEQSETFAGDIGDEGESAQLTPTEDSDGNSLDAGESMLERESGDEVRDDSTGAEDLSSGAESNRVQVDGDTETPLTASTGLENEAAPSERDASALGAADDGDEAPESQDEERGDGLIEQWRSEQDQAIEQAGGLGSIVDKLIIRIEGSSLPEPVIDYLSRELSDLKRDGRAATLAQQFLGSGLNVFRALILVLIYMLFIFAEQAVFRRKILAVAGDRREDAARILDTIGRGIQQFLGIKTLISIATAALCYSVLVSLRIPYALLFALLTFFLNFIPYFGSLIAGSLPTVTAVAIEPTLQKAIIVAATFLGVNVVLGSYVEPKIMGRELDLSPLVIIVSVVVWGALWGVVGAFLAVPLMATAQIVLASGDSTRPIAVMLSSGPPRESRRAFRRAT